MDERGALTCRNGRERTGLEHLRPVIRPYEKIQELKLRDNFSGWGFSL